MTASPNDRQIAMNIAAHQRCAARYEQAHGEIYNPVEQQRLRESLTRALGFVLDPAHAPAALDVGCGAGNLTSHLLGLGCAVTAADVAPAFLELVASNHRNNPLLTTFRLNGSDLSGFGDGSFDMAATYSVLHHIPDYLLVVREMARVLRPGGVLYLDHEHHEGFWEPTSVYKEYLAAAAPPRPPRWRKLFRFDIWYDKGRLLFDPRYRREGDIHVWPDDHIEWDRIEEALREQGLEVVVREDYLQYQRGYDLALWEQYRARCTDQRVLMARKKR